MKRLAILKTMIIDLLDTEWAVHAYNPSTKEA